MKKAIIYYTLSGSSRNAAVAMAERWGADLIEVKSKKEPNTKSPFGFIGLGFRSSTGRCVPLTSNIKLVAQPYDQLYIVSPMRAGKTDPAINTVIRDLDFKDKEVSIFSVQADPKLSHSDIMLDSMAERIEKKGGTIVFRQALAGGSPNKEMALEEMEAQINDIFQDVR